MKCVSARSTQGRQEMHVTDLGTGNVPHGRDKAMIDDKPVEFESSILWEEAAGEEVQGVGSENIRKALRDSPGALDTCPDHHFSQG